MSKNIKPQMLLSTLWIFVLFNIIFRDLHQFLAKGFIEEMISQKISEPMALLYGVILEIPIVMVLLSRILSNTANKWSNVIAAGITILGILGTLPSADLDDIFFGVVKLIALITIIRVAWKISILNREHS